MRHTTSLLLGGLLSTLAFAIQAQSHDTGHPHDHEHSTTGSSSLDAHEHGVASLNLVLDGKQLVIELDSPAANIVGFEHRPESDADRATVTQARERLLQADTLFVFSGDAGCALEEVETESTLFDSVAPAKKHEHGDHDPHHEEHHDNHDGHESHGKEAGAHADIEAHFHFVCDNPDGLKQVEVKLFDAFPRTEKLLLQAITPGGQQGGELSRAQSVIRL